MKPKGVGSAHRRLTDHHAASSMEFCDESEFSFLPRGFRYRFLLTNSRNVD